MSAQRKDSESRRQGHPDPQVRRLMARGFNTRQAEGLAAVSRGVDQSREAQESEAIMNNLRFHQWLIKTGRLREGKPTRKSVAEWQAFRRSQGEID